MPISQLSDLDNMPSQDNDKLVNGSYSYRS